MRFERFYINEKLNPSQFRDYVKAWKEQGVAGIYDDAFGDKDRIYLPFEGKVDKKARKSYIQTEVESVLDAAGWAVDDYYKGTAIQNGKVMKIGKVISRFLEKVKKTIGPDGQPHPYYNIRWIEVALKNFASDKEREAIKSGNLLICISRHAYDIAGMSTDRGWTSCQNLEHGALKSYVMKDIKAGTLIAYLIREDDKNIRKPLGRILLKPFYSQDYNDFILVAAKKYGSVPSNFKREVQKWADKNINIKKPSGTYKIDQTVYKGDNRSIKILNNPVSMKEFRARQAEIRVPMVETADQLVKYWEDPEHWNYIKHNKTEFLAGIGKKIVGRVYFNKKIKLNAAQVEEMFMKYYWQEKDAMPSYHSFFNDAFMENFTTVGPEIDTAWATLSLFTVYDTIHKFPLNQPWDKILVGINHILDESHQRWFSQRYTTTPEERERLINHAKVFFAEYGRGH